MQLTSFYATPRLILDSAEPGSGKTRVLEVAQFLVRRPEMTFSTTSAAIYRMLGEGPITLLFDEVDAIFNSKNGGNYEDLRALLNAGYKRSATVARCVGDASKMAVQRFPVYAPVALAGIAGGMPATITSRAVTVHMRRRAPGEHVLPFRERTVKAEADPIRELLAAWIESVLEQLEGAEPDMPEGVTDRPAEVWEPLLAIADAAGGRWPKIAREACVHFVKANDPVGQSLNVRLLADLRTLFSEHGADRLPTVEILQQLCAMEDAPWEELEGRPLDSRRLSKMVGRFGVRPTTYKQDSKAYKGYVVDGPVGLADAWSRYLPAILGNCGNSGNPAGEPVTDDDPVTDVSVTGEASVTELTRAVTPVTAVTATAGGESS